MPAGALLRGSALVLCTALLCTGQIIPQIGSAASPKPEQVRTLSGTVLDAATGEPIPHALVRVLSNSALAAMTGADGHFEIANVPAGRTVSIAAKRPGYGNPQMPSQDRKTVGPGDNNITIELVPQGGIQGRIVDEDGQPLEGIAVQATEEVIRNGRKREFPMNSVQTDSSGEYELGGLAPGTYFLKTRLHRLYMTYAPLPAAQQAYASEFYPNAPDRDAAQPLQVQPGQEAEADFTIKTVPTFRVSGIVTGFGSGKRGLVMLERPDGGRLSVPMRFNRRTGQFAALGVPAGSYKLVFRTYSRSEDDSYYAEKQIGVEADVTGVKIDPQPLAPIPVKIVQPAETQGSGIGSARVQLAAEDGTNNTYWARTLPHGGMEIPAVPPGTYHAAVHVFGPACLGTISSGSTDLASQDLTVSAGAAPQPITVTLRSDCATLSGIVHTDGPKAPVKVLVIPESGVAEPQTISAAPESQFSIKGFTPGDYRVYAFSTLDGLEYTNPDALADFDANEITLSPNQTASVSLNLIVRGGQ